MQGICLDDSSNICFKVFNIQDVTKTKLRLYNDCETYDLNITDVDYCNDMLCFTIDLSDLQLSATIMYLEFSELDDDEYIIKRVAKIKLYRCHDQC